MHLQNRDIDLIFEKQLIFVLQLFSLLSWYRCQSKTIQRLCNNNYCSRRPQSSLGNVLKARALQCFTSNADMCIMYLPLVWIYFYMLNVIWLRLGASLSYADMTIMYLPSVWLYFYMLNAILSRLRTSLLPHHTIFTKQ